MSTPLDVGPVKRAIALLTEWLARHEELCDIPGCNANEQLAALVCHSLGAKTDSMAGFMSELEDIERTCACCAHLRN